ncbi:MAG: ATP-dependent DNA helicase RecG [Firmicutes bacterium]|nr:ATP-dependent DNA helicase RecG [Bacillota bacterium]
MEDIKTLNGIGSRRATLFEKKGIRSVEDLLYFFPRTHEDRTKFSNIAACVPSEYVCIRAKIFAPVKETRIKKNFTVYSVTIFDDSGAMNVVWYNNRFVKDAFRTGEECMFYGKIGFNRGKKELQNPVFEKGNSGRQIGRIVPVYPLTEGLTQKMVCSAMEQAIERTGRIAEYIPKEIRSRYEIAEINFAMRNIHFPESFENYEIARKRFVFEELLILQLAILNRREKNFGVRGVRFKNTKCITDFTSALPFELTSAQKRVLGEISADLESERPMNRLVQGDVGSGKTAVAAAAMYAAYKNGYQSAIMAPTEILANQHYETFLRFFKDMPVRIVLLTSSVTKKNDLYEAIESGDADIIIGTNAIIQEKVEFKNLGLAVTDEQHRFGVSQRACLVAKGENPNVLIMTATPIPRTLSLILYGDLDVSMIDELPPGRKPVSTYAVGENMRRRVYSFLDKHIKNGSQAYVVCPLIEESEKNDLANAKGIFDKLAAIFPQYNIGLVHGKMRAAEKDTIMRDFVDGKIDILVSTTVIEVGVNVPNSNIMIIENAERFGLSTLHQLRGRVGRGQDQAFCIMFVHSDNEITKKRMKIMCRSNDGFYISEEDLKLRGPGDFFGTRQHGLPELKIANLFCDMDILKSAQKAATEIESGEFSKNCDLSILRKKVDKLICDNIVLN